MKKFILDTDIGADCDDAAALLYLLGKMKAGECDIKAITLCTRRKFASAAAKAFVTEFGYGEIPIGEYKGEPLPCDSCDNYAEVVAGARVATKAGSTKGLTRKAMEAFFKSIDERGGTRYEENPERTRPSWDPLTCMAAMNEKKFDFSEKGEVRVLGGGFTEFIKTETGKCRYMTLKNDFKKAEKELNEYLETL